MGLPVRCEECVILDVIEFVCFELSFKPNLGAELPNDLGRIWVVLYYVFTLLFSK